MKYRYRIKMISIKKNKIKKATASAVALSLKYHFGFYRPKAFFAFSLLGFTVNTLLKYCLAIS